MVPRKVFCGATCPRRTGMLVRSGSAAPGARGCSSARLRGSGRGYPAPAPAPPRPAAAIPAPPSAALGARGGASAGRPASPAAPRQWPRGGAAPGSAARLTPARRRGNRVCPLLRGGDGRGGAEPPPERAAASGARARAGQEGVKEGRKAALRERKLLSPRVPEAAACRGAGRLRCPEPAVREGKGPRSPEGGSGPCRSPWGRGSGGRSGRVARPARSCPWCCRRPAAPGGAPTPSRSSRAPAAAASAHSSTSRGAQGKGRLAAGCNQGMAGTWCQRGAEGSRTVLKGAVARSRKGP